MFYNKINSRLTTNSNVSFYNNLNEIKSENSIIFNSVFEKQLDKSELWQHFQGIEIETPKKIFDEEITGFNIGIIFMLFQSVMIWFPKPK